MKQRNTVVRALHDVGIAAWFGGSLMGAVALNGAANTVTDPTGAVPVASAGWARWTPVNAAAIGAHLIGGVGLLLANRDRARLQAGVTANTNVKLVLTAAALTTTAYSGVLGAKLAKAGAVASPGAVTPSDQTPPDVANVQQQLRALQWATPALTGLVVILGAQQGEQQRSGEVLRGVQKKIVSAGLNKLHR